MSSYGVLLFVHVAAVILWVGGGILFQILTERAAKRSDLQAVRTVAGMADGVGKSYFAILSVVVLATGLSLVLHGGWGFDHLFIIGGLIGVVVASVIGAKVIGPTAGGLGEKLTAAGDFDDVRSDVTRLRDVGRVDAAVMLTVVFLMTVKPGS